MGGQVRIRSYGFRPGRGCQDAIQAVFVTARGAACKRVWALDADLAAAFDRIDHSHLLDQPGQFPARELVAGWLSAGVMDRGRFAPTERGNPQGGVISPVLMNVALHGMEQAAGVRYIPTGSNAGTARPGSPVVIRYADDVLALCHSREQAEQVQARLVAWLAPRGLVFNEDKTRIVHLADDGGVDFLGFNTRRYRGKLLIKPSKAAMARIRARLTAEMKALRGHNAQMVLIRLNPMRARPVPRGPRHAQRAGATRLLGGRCLADRRRAGPPRAPVGGEGVRLPASEERRP